MADKGKLSQLEQAVDRVSKKQKTSRTKTISQIDFLLSEVNKCKLLLNPDNMDTDNGVNCKDAITMLHTKVTNGNVMNVINEETKELHSVISKLGKTVDKSINYNPDIKLYDQPINFNNKIMNEIIAHHFFKQGKFEIGDSFLQESQLKIDNNLRDRFIEMYKIVENIKKHKNLIPAIQWCHNHKQELQNNDLSLEFNLHKLQFINLINDKKQEEAIKYAKQNFTPFANTKLKEIQKLMGCLLYIGRLETSPYNQFCDPSLWETIEYEFISANCIVMGLPSESPLYTTVTAGTIALPKQHKVAALMQSKSVKFQNIEIELGTDFHYHPIFACPVTREQSTIDNPPMLLVCGHVISKASMLKLARNNSRFKCPYCPTDQSTTKAIQVIF